MHSWYIYIYTYYSLIAHTFIYTQIVVGPRLRYSNCNQTRISYIIVTIIIMYIFAVYKYDSKGHLPTLFPCLVIVLDKGNIKSLVTSSPSARALTWIYFQKGKCACPMFVRTEVNQKVRLRRPQHLHACKQSRAMWLSCVVAWGCWITTVTSVKVRLWFCLFSLFIYLFVYLPWLMTHSLPKLHIITYSLQAKTRWYNITR